jgi:predicted MFS family arabinose efflux permease
MSGYGLGSVVGTVISLAVIRRIPPVPLASVAWAVMGLCWVGMGLWTTPAAVAVLAALGGVAVVLGITAISAVITRSSAGAERRALLSGQSVVVNASSSAGLLVGGPVIAAVGAEPTLIGSGVLTAAVALSVLFTRSHPRRRGLWLRGEGGGNLAAGEAGYCQTAGHVPGCDHHARRAA